MGLGPALTPCPLSQRLGGGEAGAAAWSDPLAQLLGEGAGGEGRPRSLGRRAAVRLSGRRVVGMPGGEVLVSCLPRRKSAFGKETIQGIATLVQRADQATRPEPACGPRT